MQKIRVVDSHTGGEPTRVVVEGFPQFQSRTLAGMRDELLSKHDDLRAGLVLEPRGSDVVVGAILTPPETLGCVAGVVFFNNIGALGMCGHGLIGVVETLRFLGRLHEATVKLDTPVGPVSAELLPDGRVAIQNVPSYRYRKDVALKVPRVGEVVGDIAWGGNWFFLVRSPKAKVHLSRVDALTDTAWRIRRQLGAQGITGEGGAEIDHVELFEPTTPSRNFVLCPGKAFDRSPCGTGTSAKMACLAVDGELAPGQTWVQIGITGSSFEGTYQELDGRILPTIIGQAFITSEATLIFDDRDPLRAGFR